MNAPDPHAPCNYFTAFWQAHHAANATTRGDHVWQLELGLEALCRRLKPRVISPRDRDRLHDNLQAARLVSERILAERYPPEQIELGYRAAHGVVTAWAMAPDERHAFDPRGALQPALVCFRADIGNMRRMDGLARRAPGVVLNNLLPPLPRMPGTHEGARILSFPEF